MLRKAIAILPCITLLCPLAAFAVIHQVNITGFDFVPVGITVAPGDTVRWTNNDAAPHTSTSDGGVWNSGTLSTGQSYMRAFASVGSFPYHCAIHTSMRDTITVVAPADVEISIGDNFFDPPVVQINVGETVQWTNNGAMTHTATAQDSYFDSGDLIPGATYSFTFNEEGVHDYECIFHSGMVGTIVVGRPDSVVMDIRMINTEFQPADVSVTVGDYVRWINFDTMEHTTTDTSASLWDSGTMEQGDVFILQANTVGMFDYICSFHPGMAGALEVAPVIDQMVHIFDNYYDPAVVQIQPGQTILWMSMAGHSHTTTSDIGLWDSGVMNSGDMFYFTFENEGVYDYHCTIHGLSMSGTVVVGRPDSVAYDTRIIDNDFDPSTLNISVGENVRWVNYGANQHTTTDTSANAWDSGTLDPGDFFIYHADTPGDFYYRCTIHSGQDGLLSVQDTSTGGGCVYVPGDINGNGAANGIDVTFGVSYLKGGAMPPDICVDCPSAGQNLFSAMDVNGSCSANGIDITFFVAYLKSLQPALLFCPTCPPATARSASW